MNDIFTIIYLLYSKNIYISKKSIFLHDLYH